MSAAPVIRRPALFALVLLAAACALRWPMLDRQIWNLDEGSTVTMAELVRDGKVLYRDAADNRTPLVPYAKALVLAVAGDWNMNAIHLALALMTGLTAVLLWAIGRRLGQEWTGVFAAGVFTLLQTGLLPPIDSMTAHTGWFLILCSALGFWLLAGALAARSAGRALAAGVAFGLSYLAKQPGLLDFGAAVVLVGIILGADPARRADLRRLLPALVAGFALTLAATAAYFAAHGALADLVFYAWTYNTRYYVPEVSVADRLAAMRIPFYLLLTRQPFALLLGLLAAAGLLHAAFGGLRRSRSPIAPLPWLILGWTAAGLLSTALSGRDFGHYSIQVMPGLALACGWLLARGLAWAREARAAPRPANVRLLGILTALGLASLAVPLVASWVQREPDDPAGTEVGQLVQRHSRTDERIFVWGYVPEMHVYARRLPNTRFVYSVFVTGLIPWTNLDFLQDTAYAIVPDAPAALRGDFARRPPAVIVDGTGLRGFLKYPLERQGWLWRTIEYEFAEIEPEYARARGFKVYRRIADARYGAPFPRELPVDPQVRLEAPAAVPPDTTARVQVSVPADTTVVELYKDGELYRRLERPAGTPGTVAFFAVGTDLPLGARTLQAVARGATDRAGAPRRLEVAESARQPPPGPPLEFGGVAHAPLEAFNLHGALARLPGNDHWDAHAPSKLVYARPPGVHSVHFSFGLRKDISADPHANRSDGVEVAVQFESASGQLRTLYRRLLAGHGAPEERGLQTAEVALPPDEKGRIILWISPGLRSDAAGDWAYWGTVRGEGSPARLAFRGGTVHAAEVAAPLGLNWFEVQGRRVLAAHAPSHFDFPLASGMHLLRGSFGLLPEAWTGPKRSAGAVFEVLHLPPGGAPRVLFSQLADPAHNPAHRGPQDFTVDLPYPSTGVLSLSVRPAHPENNAFNYTYWGPLAVEEFAAEMAAPGGPVRSVAAGTEYGFAHMEEAGRPVVFAHAPAHLVFPLPAGARRLTGEHGLLAAAVSGPEAAEGGRFIIEWEDASGRRTRLWQRDLNPRDIPADRGFLPFAVDLPPGASGRLWLRTEARPGGSISRAWTFWAGLRLETSP